VGYFLRAALLGTGFALVHVARSLGPIGLGVVKMWCESAAPNSPGWPTAASSRPRKKPIRKKPIFQIERSSLELQTRLLADGLESAEAKAFLESMATPEQLIQQVTVEEIQLAIRRWRSQRNESMNAQFNYGGRIHTFQVPIGPRPDGTIGPPTEVIVDGSETGDSTLRRRKRERWRLAYDGVDPEHDRLNYRVNEVL
jgi:hypothetical protein